MEGRRVYDGSDMTVLLPTQKPPSSSLVLDSFWISNSPSSFQGSTSMVKFENSLDKEENGNEEYDGCSHRPEKKRRLAVDQVEFLERSFEVENKLGPERKVQLANELGLQPRQIAIWFQNRRARYKSKLIEKDYDCLKASYDKLKADHDSLLKDNEKLKIEVNLLKEKLLLREKGKARSEPCDPINSLDTQPQKAFPNAISQNVPMVCDANSAKSDVFDSDSPRYTDGNHSSVLEPAVSSHVRGPEHSDFSQDEDDNLRRTILSLPCFPKLEEGCYHELNANSCNLGYTVEDEPFWFWPY